MVLGLAAIGLVLSGVVADDRVDCAAVGSRVAGLETFSWDNGFTSSGSEWVSVLTDGVTEADAPSRRAIAGAVQSDETGYQHFRDGLSDEAAMAADRLRQVASEPASVEAADVRSIEQDSAVLRRHAQVECGFA